MVLLRTTDEGEGVAFGDFAALVGADFDESAAEGCGNFVDAAVAVEEVAEAVALLVFLADHRFDALDAFAVATYLPHHRTAVGSDDGVGFGVLVGGDVGQREALLLHFLFLRGLQVVEEALLGDAALVVAVLAFVHGKLEEFFVVLTAFPSVLLHLLDEAWQVVGVVRLRVGVGELKAFLFGEFDDFGCHGAGQFAALAENHAPDGLVHHRVARFAHRLGEQVHEGDVLDVL